MYPYNILYPIQLWEFLLLDRYVAYFEFAHQKNVLVFIVQFITSVPGSYRTNNGDIKEQPNHIKCGLCLPLFDLCNPCPLTTTPPPPLPPLVSTDCFPGSQSPTKQPQAEEIGSGELMTMFCVLTTRYVWHDYFAHRSH